MRISDWSSDVCSSDLWPGERLPSEKGEGGADDGRNHHELDAFGMNRRHAVFHGRARCAFGRCHEAVVGRDRPTDNALLRCGADRDANAKMTPARSPGNVIPPSSTSRAGKDRTSVEDDTRRAVRG